MTCEATLRRTIWHHSRWQNIHPTSFLAANFKWHVVLQKLEFTPQFKAAGSDAAEQVYGLFLALCALYIDDIKVSIRVVTILEFKLDTNTQKNKYISTPCCNTTEAIVQTSYLENVTLTNFPSYELILHTFFLNLSLDVFFVLQLNKCNNRTWV